MVWWSLISWCDGLVVSHLLDLLSFEEHKFCSRLICVFIVTVGLFCESGLHWT